MIHYTFYKITIFAPAPSGPPQNIGHEVLNYKSIRLFWALPLLRDQNGDITGYSVQVLTTDDIIYSFYKAVEEGVIVDSLKEYTSYKFHVSAMTSVGEGPYKTYGPVTTAMGELQECPKTIIFYGVLNGSLAGL